MTLRIVCSLCLSLLVLPALAQQMYKWVDEKGVTHYSETPPPDGTKGAAKIEVKTPTPDRPANDNWRERERQSREQRAKQGVADEQERKKEESQRDSNCRRAQRQADVMSRPTGVYRLNDKGERVFLEDKERDAKLEEARQEIARYCR
jgi:hypothetical protein